MKVNWLTVWSRLILVLSLFEVALGSAISFTCPTACKSDIDCSLNGKCQSDNTCACEAAWEGTCCESLSLLPVPLNSSYRSKNVSTWGGNIITKDNGQTYHMWIAEMAPDPSTGGGCGLTTWEKNSQITHVSSKGNPTGPYTREAVAVPMWSHNPIVRIEPITQLLVLWHIGTGTQGNNPPFGYCTHNGTSPCGEQSFDQCAKDYNNNDDNNNNLQETSNIDKDNIDDSVYEDMYIRSRRRKMEQEYISNDNTLDQSLSSCTLPIHTSSTVDGPWTAYNEAVITPCAGNNPSPFYHPLNGTLFAVFTEQNMGLYRADSYKGPYTLVTQGACGGGEDPSLYIDLNGNFHCLYHRSPFNNPNIAIGHSFSNDGYTWYTSVAAAANSTIVYEDLGPVVHGKRERPRLYFDKDTGEISHFVTGVCLDPSCDPLDNKIVEGVDCSATAQYARCDTNSPNGYYDKTYTLVQPVRRKQ